MMSEFSVTKINMNTQYAKFGKKLAISRGIPEFLWIPESFQEWWNFEFQVSWQKLSGKNTLNVEFSEN